MSSTIISPKKLIEVALPLDAINTAAAREKAMRHGQPSNLHRWWARRPLAAARAVIFSQMVNDPSWKWELENAEEIPPGHLKASWAASRKRLFSLIEELVLWESNNNETVLKKCHDEIRKSWMETCELNKNHPQAATLFNPNKLPGLHDPFAGGGAIPLEAQRLGLEAYASDLNPVAVLINKAMIEIPPKFADRPPVNSELRQEKSLIGRNWKGAQGIAEDVLRYAEWVRSKAKERIGHLYPLIEVTTLIVKERPDLKPYLGEKLTVIAWLWARTVKSPNPAFSHVDIPLASSFTLCNKPGKEAYVQPVIENARYRFTVKIGKPSDEAKAGTKSARGANFRCLMSQAAVEPAYIKAEAMAGRMGAKLMAIVAEGTRGRVYLPPTAEHEAIADSANSNDAAASIHVPLANDPRNLWYLQYGLDHFDKLFTERQLIALTTLSDLAIEAREKVKHDALAAGMLDDGHSLDSGQAGAQAYSDAVVVYLGLAISKASDSNNSLCPWEPVAQCSRQLFGRQAIPMVWDFAEANPLHDSSGGFITNVTGSLHAFDCFLSNAVPGHAAQHDAARQTLSSGKVISTDPPYYDNIGYADLSDFFYVWLRRSLKPIIPSLFATLNVPKAEELIANPYRHGGKGEAEAFFMDGMTSAMRRLIETSHPAFPITIYYAFKQSETEGALGTSSTGWETFLDALIVSGFALVGTWPMRTEMTAALKTVTNSLASSIVLVCRKRLSNATTISRRQFIRELNAVLPIALDAMTRESEGLHSPVAPVDLSQAIIGPGMAVFSKYAAVLEADGTPMTVRTALQIINRFLAEDDFDPDTQFCLRWFEQHGWEKGQFGEADVLARAKGTSVEGVKQSGVLQAAAGNARLLKWDEYPIDWNPQTDQRLPVWEVLHQLVRIFNTTGETGAGEVLVAVQAKAEAARQLAYRLYTLCERAGRAEDARAYNEVVTSWSGIESAAAKVPTPTQRTLFE
jgi:putative DNA methylase